MLFNLFTEKIFLKELKVSLQSSCHEVMYGRFHVQRPTAATTSNHCIGFQAAQLSHGDTWTASTIKM